MRTARLSDMKRGWFIGDFTPSLYKTDACEVAVKKYIAGEHEAKHYHLAAEEYTVIISGEVKMFGNVYKAGDIIICERGDATDFTAITDTVNVVVKIPGAKNDKYVMEED